MRDGIRLLNQRRGQEKIAFKDVADHLVDYVERFPDEAEAIDKLARFLAGVEDVDHEHAGPRELGSDV
jgi:hypothetical protein